MRPSRLCWKRLQTGDQHASLILLFLPQIRLIRTLLVFRPIPCVLGRLTPGASKYSADDFIDALGAQLALHCLHPPLLPTHPVPLNSVERSLVACRTRGCCYCCSRWELVITAGCHRPDVVAPDAFARRRLKRDFLWCGNVVQPSVLGAWHATRRPGCCCWLPTCCKQ
jgi:hypothetical protein